MDTILLHPTYFPSIAQMAAMVQATHVIFEKEGTYQKQSYRNRAYIAHSNGKLLLSIPVKHSHDGTRLQYKEVAIENDFPWQSHHLKSLQSAYRTSPFFEYYEDEMTPLFTESVSGLWEHNIKIIHFLLETLGADIDFSYSERYVKTPEATDLRYMANAKREKKIKVPHYHQVFEAKHGFLHNLSILDLFFSEGPNTLNYLEKLDLKVVSSE
ncbi:WbqC family protein [Jejudonia soesokkakensis]|uniref:WbqC family protein n=1 Tax=Jejudonia soesokkakensis TaxID=1323432 RepID=A0ABW2MX57_9FLAO